MAFWSSEKLRQRLRSENLISDYDEEAIKHCSYELAMGSEATVTQPSKEKKQKRKIVLKDREPLEIPPG